MRRTSYQTERLFSANFRMPSLLSDRDQQWSTRFACQQHVQGGFADSKNVKRGTLSNVFSEPKLEPPRFQRYLTSTPPASRRRISEGSSLQGETCSVRSSLIYICPRSVEAQQRTIEMRRTRMRFLNRRVGQRLSLEGKKGREQLGVCERVRDILQEWMLITWTWWKIDIVRSMRMMRDIRYIDYVSSLQSFLRLSDLATAMQRAFLSDSGWSYLQQCRSQFPPLLHMYGCVAPLVDDFCGSPST